MGLGVVVISLHSLQVCHYSFGPYIHKHAILNAYQCVLNYPKQEMKVCFVVTPLICMAEV